MVDPEELQAYQDAFETCPFSRKEAVALANWAGMSEHAEALSGVPREDNLALRMRLAVALAESPPEQTPTAINEIIAAKMEECDRILAVEIRERERDINKRNEMRAALERDALRVNFLECVSPDERPIKDAVQFSIPHSLLAECAQEIEELHSEFVIPPFPVFEIRANAPVSRVFDDSPFFERVEFDRILVDASQEDEWTLYSTISPHYKGRSIGEYVVRQRVRISTGELFVAKRSEFKHLVVKDWMSEEFKTLIRESREAPISAEDHWVDVSMMEAGYSCGVLHEYVIGFLLLLNNRKVVASERISPNRAERKRRVAAGDPPVWHTITVPSHIAARNLILQSAVGKNVKMRGPHWVRSHPRRLPSGKVIPVTGHARCRKPGVEIVPGSYDMRLLLNERQEAS